MAAVAGIKVWITCTTYSREMMRLQRNSSQISNNKMHRLYPFFYVTWLHAMEKLFWKLQSSPKDDSSVAQQTVKVLKLVLVLHWKNTKSFWYLCRMELWQISNFMKIHMLSRISLVFCSLCPTCARDQQELYSQTFIRTNMPPQYISILISAIF